VTTSLSSVLSPKERKKSIVEHLSPFAVWSERKRKKPRTYGEGRTRPANIPFQLSGEVAILLFPDVTVARKGGHQEKGGKTFNQRVRCPSAVNEELGGSLQPRKERKRLVTIPALRGGENQRKGKGGGARAISARWEEQSEFLSRQKLLARRKEGGKKGCPTLHPPRSKLERARSERALEKKISCMWRGGRKHHCFSPQKQEKKSGESFPSAAEDVDFLLAVERGRRKVPGKRGTTAAITSGAAPALQVDHDKKSGGGVSSVASLSPVRTAKKRKRNPSATL